MKRAALLALLIAACATPLRINKSYQPADEERVRVAIVPVLSEPSDLSDLAFEMAFKDAPCVLVPLGPLRERLGRDERLRNLLDAAVKGAWDDSDLTRAPRLQEVVGESGLKEIREALGGAELLIYPISLELRSHLGEASAAMTYRLYDLRDGRIILQNKKGALANGDDVDGMQGVVLNLLAASVRLDFQEHYLLRRAANPRPGS
jgi:hypothetical protein